MRCCATPESFSPASNILGNHSVRDKASQPERASAKVAPKPRARKRLRESSARVFIGNLRIDAITLGDHRAQMIPETADDHLEDVSEDEGDQKPRDDEVDGSR